MGALQGRRILVIEDDYLIAEVVIDLLESAGAAVVGPIGWVEEALSLLRGNGTAFDGAVLDVNLHGQTSYPIADALVEHDIRFVFVTGYDLGALEDAYRSHPRCEKPFQADALIAALSAIEG